VIAANGRVEQATQAESAAISTLVEVVRLPGTSLLTKSASIATLAPYVRNAWSRPDASATLE